MTFTLTKTSEWDFKETINIDTLEQLQELSAKYGTALVVSFFNAGPTIEIYDDWRE